MTPSSFTEYALSGNLSEDEVYTVELLIERVRSKFDPYWLDDLWSKRGDARERPGYKPTFEPSEIPLAAPELEKLTWLSFQRIRESERAVRNLSALRFLPALTGLVLIGSDVSDISVLRHCKQLRRLELSGTPVRDLSSIEACHELEELNLRKTTIEDFSTLELLPKLRKLEISAEQTTLLNRLSCLPSLKQIELEELDSFRDLPTMPMLREIRGATVHDLEGLEKFPTVVNLVNLWGDFASLEPLRALKGLTHINILSSRVTDLSPFSGLLALRGVWLSTELPELDLTPLCSLPTLHKISIRCADKDHPDLEDLRSELTSWDVEFLAPNPRYIPCLQIEVVDQKTFDFYDTEKRYGVTEADNNYSLLSSEVAWLDDKIEDVFCVDFEKDEDFSIPFRWAGGRSRTVVLLSERAREAFARLALGIQQVLAHARNDWIIYFQSDLLDDGDFIVWLYPEKIMVAEEYADVVRKLVKPQ